MYKEYSPENDNSTTEMVLVCTEAHQKEIKEFEEKIDKVQDRLDETDYQFDKVDDYSVITTWRQAIVACKYSLEDIPTLFDD